MKAIVVRNSKIPKLLSIFINARAVTIFPFIFISDEGDEITINHEKIHIEQYRELWVLGFLFMYTVDYIRSLYLLRHVRKDLGTSEWTSAAYYNIRFEQEAHAHQQEFDYLQKRSKNSWTNYQI
jgi:hypothetical protein